MSRLGCHSIPLPVLHTATGTDDAEACAPAALIGKTDATTRNSNARHSQMAVFFDSFGSRATSELTPRLWWCHFSHDGTAIRTQVLGGEIALIRGDLYGVEASSMASQVK